jgi:Zn-dependent peptidase ImmA (M78 family)
MAERIQRLLASSEVPEGQLAQVLDLPSGVTVDEVLTGSHPLAPTDLVAVADLLDVPVTVLTGQVPIDRHLGVSLRLGSLQAPDVPEEALQNAELHLRYQALLDSWLSRPRSPLAAVSMSTDGYYKGAGQESARRVRDALGLGEYPIPDLLDVVEKLGFPVIFQPLPTGMHGLNVRDEREGVPIRVIVISTNGPWTLQRYTLAHELCHALYDDPGQVIIDLVDVPERLPELRAEQFARYLLLPAKALQRDIAEARSKKTPWDSLTAQLMVRWGMSRSAVARALLSDGLAREEDLAEVQQRPVPDLMARAGLTEQWRDLCREQGTACGSPWLVRRAVEAYGKGWVGAHVVADLLGQDLETTTQQLLEQGWATPDAVEF